MWLVNTAAVDGNLPIRLDRGEYLVGRCAAADILVRHRTVSLRHAKLLVRPKSLIVEDLGSRHGTFVNEQPINVASFRLGNQIRFGTVLCIVSPAAMIPAETIPLEDRRKGKPAAADDGLTPAQQQVLRLALRGLDEEAIADELDRSWHTVHTHMKAIFKHFQVHTRAQLMAGLLAAKGKL